MTMSLTYAERVALYRAGNGRDVSPAPAPVSVAMPLPRRGWREREALAKAREAARTSEDAAAIRAQRHDLVQQLDAARCGAVAEPPLERSEVRVDESRDDGPEVEADPSEVRAHEAEVEPTKRPRGRPRKR